MNYKIFIEYDDTRLKVLSDEIYNLFKNNNYDVTILDNTISLNNKLNSINSISKKIFLLSNKIGTDSSSLEIIYPLRSNDEISRTLSDNLSNITTVSKYYQLRLPSETSKDYYEILRDVNTNDAIIIKYGINLLNNSNLASFIYRSIVNYLTNENIYTVKSGDSLYSIARNFNITVDELKKLNNLTTNNLSLGQKLLIPTTNTTPTIPEEPTASNTYTVKSGDSLYAIARNFNTTVDEIKKLNNLTSNNLSIGQKLLIPSKDSFEQPNDTITYTVKSGDSLYAIARKFNTTVDEIKRLNNLTRNNLSLGQKLSIPSSVSSNQPNDTITYTVKSGDSLYAIARTFNTTVNEIKRLNNLTSNNLSIGQKLIIK